MRLCEANIPKFPYILPLHLSPGLYPHKHMSCAVPHRPTSGENGTGHEGCDSFVVTLSSPVSRGSHDQTSRAAIIIAVDNLVTQDTKHLKYSHISSPTSHTSLLRRASAHRGLSKQAYRVVRLQAYVQGVQLKSERYFNMSNLFTKIYNMLYYTTNLYLQ